MSSSPMQNVHDVRAKLLSHRKMLEHRNAFSYVYTLLRTTTAWRRWNVLLTYLRRFRLLARLWEVAVLTLTVLETGALVVLTTALFLVLLPVLVIGGMSFLLSAWMESQKKNRALDRRTKGRRIYVLFMSDGENPFLAENAKSLAADKDQVVVVVSPFWFSPKGLGDGAFFSTVREEWDGVYLVRKYYFFSLKKHVLDQRETAYLY